MYMIDMYMCITYCMHINLISSPKYLFFTASLFFLASSRPPVDYYLDMLLVFLIVPLRVLCIAFLKILFCIVLLLSAVYSLAIHLGTIECMKCNKEKVPNYN